MSRSSKQANNVISYIYKSFKKKIKGRKENRTWQSWQAVTVLIREADLWIEEDHQVLMFCFFSLMHWCGYTSYCLWSSAVVTCDLLWLMKGGQKGVSCRSFKKSWLKFDVTSPPPLELLWKYLLRSGFLYLRGSTLDISPWFENCFTRS